MFVKYADGVHRLSRRLRHPGRAVRGADADPDREGQALPGDTVRQRVLVRAGRLAHRHRRGGAEDQPARTSCSSRSPTTRPRRRASSSRRAGPSRTTPSPASQDERMTRPSTPYLRGQRIDPQRDHRQGNGCRSGGQRVPGLQRRAPARRLPALHPADAGAGRHRRHDAHRRDDAGRPRHELSHPADGGGVRGLDHLDRREPVPRRALRARARDAPRHAPARTTWSCASTAWCGSTTSSSTTACCSPPTRSSAKSPRARSSSVR